MRESWYDVINMGRITKLYLVRHGQSLHNVNNIVSGQHGDPPLTDHGREQARHAKENLASVTIDVVYSSDLQRARETAEIIIGRQISKDNQLAELRERYFGKLEGVHSTEFEKLHVRTLGLPDEQRWHHRLVDDMETDHELSERWHSMLEVLAGRHPGQTMLVVGHGSSIRTFLMKLGYATYAAFPPGSLGNTAIAEVDYGPNGFQVVRLQQPKL